MTNAVYQRAYISGDASSSNEYRCSKCGNSQFTPGAIYCHICGEKLPAGMYVEYRTVLQMRPFTAEETQELKKKLQEVK